MKRKNPKLEKLATFNVSLEIHARVKRLSERTGLRVRNVVERAIIIGAGQIEEAFKP